MDTQAFLDNVKEILEIDDRELVLEDAFKTYEEWDSLAYLSLIAMIDEEYGVVINATDIRTVNTLAELTELIEAKKG